MDIIGKILITIIILCLIILINLETKEHFTELNNNIYENENINSVFSNYDIDYNYDWIEKIPITSEENSIKKNIYSNFNKNFLNDNKINHNPITAEKLFYNKTKFYI